MKRLKEAHMLEKIQSPEVREIMNDKNLTHHDRIKKLMKIRDDARAEQRMASEGPTVDDDGLNSKLRDVEMLLDKLGEAPAAEEGKGANTL
jgi:hypothetical protein